MLKRLFAIILILSVLGCSVVDTSLEKNDLYNLSVYEDNIGGASVLVTVFANHGNSALVVRKIVQSRTASSTINIHVYLSLPMFADKGSPSQISYSVIVPADINKVTIGDDEQIIWVRSNE
ncbi:hypothetical protein FEK47_18355 [Escherichia sp. E3659]|uniref:hypothetical protein n=1 Tax=Escherichia sp. E3659 TaxID=2044462 RepID=UPI0010801281|nr:hypothetical protein [Escherichia sp. E3659]TLJ10116.1 hypothetical protein FEK47_18355 [Escherichia sp. E3659]